MICLDNSFLVNRFRERAYTETYLDSLDAAVAEEAATRATLANTADRDDPGESDE
jgi:hypothetical protein